MKYVAKKLVEVEDSIKCVVENVRGKKISFRKWGPTWA